MQTEWWKIFNFSIFFFFIFFCFLFFFFFFLFCFLFLFFFFVAQLELAVSSSWWDFYICDCLATKQVVTLWLQVMVLVEEGCGKNTDEWADKAERQQKEKTTEGRKTKEELDVHTCINLGFVHPLQDVVLHQLDRKEKPGVKLLRFESRRWSCFIRPRSAMDVQLFDIIFPTENSSFSSNSLFSNGFCDFKWHKLLLCGAL